MAGIGRRIERYPPGIPLHDPRRAVLGERRVRDVAAQGRGPEHRPGADLGVAGVPGMPEGQGGGIPARTLDDAVASPS